MERRCLRAERLVFLAVAENSDAMAADTSSSPAANSAVVPAVATVLAALIAELIPAKSVAAEAIISGVTITYDISVGAPCSSGRWGSGCSSANQIRPKRRGWLE